MARTTIPLTITAIRAKFASRTSARSNGVQGFTRHPRVRSASAHILGTRGRRPMVRRLRPGHPTEPPPELSRQFDGWIWFEETRAVSARPDAHPHGPDETYPFGL